MCWLVSRGLQLPGSFETAVIAYELGNTSAWTWSFETTTGSERERCKTNDLVRVGAGVVLRALTLLSRARRVRDP